MVPKFRKKPVVVEAMQWPVITPRSPRITETVRPFFEWIVPECRASGYRGAVAEFSDFWQDGELHARIKTLEDTKDSWHYVSPGDWIINGVKGEFYACKPDIFEETYEPVREVLGI